MRKKDSYSEIIPVQFHDFIIIKNEIWYAASGFNGLFCAEVKTGKSRFIGRFPNEDDSAGRDLFGCMCCYNDKLIFAPLRAKNIAIYNIKLDKFESYKIPDPEMGWEKHDMKFFAVTIFEHYIFFLGCVTPVIAKLDILSFELAMYYDWFDKFKIYGVKLGKSMFDRHIVVIDESFYVTSRQNNTLMSYNMKTNENSIYEVGEIESQYATLCYDGNNFWMVDEYRHQLISFNRKLRKINKKIQLTQEDIGNFDIVYSKEKIWLFTKRFQCGVRNYCLVYDIQKDKILEVNLFNQPNDYGVVFAKEVEQNVFCMFPDRNNISVLAYEDNKLMETEIKLFYDSNVYRLPYMSNQRQGLYTEKEIQCLWSGFTLVQQNLNTFMKLVALNQDDYTNIANDSKREYGNLIWNLTKWRM